MSARFIAVTLAVLALAAGCSAQSSSARPSRTFCETANRYETELQREVTNGKVDAAKQISIIQALAAAAPKAVKRDAQTFLTALERVKADPNLRNNRSITEPAHRAADRVNRYASNRCGFFNQQPGGI